MGKGERYVSVPSYLMNSEIRLVRGCGAIRDAVGAVFCSHL